MENADITVTVFMSIICAIIAFFIGQSRGENNVWRDISSDSIDHERQLCYGVTNYIFDQQTDAETIFPVYDKNHRWVKYNSYVWLSFKGLALPAHMSWQNGSSHLACPFRGSYFTWAIGTGPHPNLTGIDIYKYYSADEAYAMLKEMYYNTNGRGDLIGFRKKPRAIINTDQSSR